MSILSQDPMSVLTDQWGRFRSLRLASPITPTVGPGDDGFLWLDIGVDGTPSAPVWKVWDEASAIWIAVSSPAAWSTVMGKPSTFDPTLANPSASVGLTAIDGSAATGMRSDGAPGIDQTITPMWAGTHTFANDVILSGSGKAVKGSGSNHPDLGTTTAADKIGSIYQLAGYDAYPRGIGYGIGSRVINLGTSAVITDHFWSGVIPTGYAWLVDGTFTQPDAILDYSANGDYLSCRFSGAARGFLYKATTGAIVGSLLYARILAINAVDTGIRLSDGSDGNYFETCLIGPAATATFTFRLRERVGGGAVTTTDVAAYLAGAGVVVITWVRNLGAPNWRPELYVSAEDGTGAKIIQGASCSWTPARVGLVTRSTATPDKIDWFSIP